MVIDNSESMAQKQEMLKEGLPELIKDLLDPPVNSSTGMRSHSPIHDLRVGVVSSDLGVMGYSAGFCEKNPLVGDDAVLQNTPRLIDCESNYDPYLTYRNYDLFWVKDPDKAVVDEFVRDFGCIALLGADGCIFEQPLEAARRALYEKGEPGMENEGFLREDSILVILIISDEDDCSVEDPSIFNIQDISEEKSAIECYKNRDKLYPIKRYIDAFKKLRCPSDIEECQGIPDNLIVNFIVGVPPDSSCENFGNRLEGCLEDPRMQVRINSDETIVEKVCGYPPGCSINENCSFDAFPGIRYVEMARELGENAQVQSICSGDFSSGFVVLKERVEAVIYLVYYEWFSLDLKKDPDDPCRCISECKIIEILSDDRECPPEEIPYDEDGDTVGDRKRDPKTGKEHTLCEIPQAGTLTSRCDLPCNSSEAVYTAYPGKKGWWYNPYEKSFWDSPNPFFLIHSQEIFPERSSSVILKCNRCIYAGCPEIKVCGNIDDPYSKCCDLNEYCYFPDEQSGRKNDGYCLLREDVCKQFGLNEWCPLSQDNPLYEDLSEIGGICCVDPDMDGNLDIADIDGDGLPDLPEYECRDGNCVKVR